ncbi:MAG: Crp/Fnr family transcriptional regulator [Sphingobacterium sp.]
MEALKFAYQHPLFSAADLELIFAAHQRVDLNKGDFILEEGQIAQAYYVLEEGLIRSFLYDYHGHDITTGFVGEKEVVIEVSSFFQRIPTQEYMQCISDCQLWKINYRTFQDLFHQIPAFREWGRAWMAYELYLSKKRATEMITEPAKKRYLHLLEEKPHLIQQAPLKFIATFLGITDTSLSRIRKEIASGHS